jgi:hypothetical protein
MDLSIQRVWNSQTAKAINRIADCPDTQGGSHAATPQRAQAN